MSRTSRCKKQSQSIVFIDTYLEDFQFLAAGVNEGLEVVIIDPFYDGVQQMTKAIAEFASRQGLIDEIHIFSHGSPGSIQLGNTFLNSDTLETASSFLSKWKTALKETADILLYGCRVATGNGSAFVEKLSQLIGVNIAASVNLTGSNKLGANWDLEFATGEIQANIPLSPTVRENYPGVLATLTVTNNNDSGEGSLREAIATAEPGDTIVFASNLANQRITLTSGQLDINKDLIIDAVDAPGLTISGNNEHRVIETSFQTNVTIRNLTIANGNTTESGVTGSGGGIKTASQTTLTVENTTFENNVTSGEGGGAILAGHRSNTTIINSKFDNNDATAGESERGGGAISTNGFAVLTIENSEFTNNKGINGGALNTPSTALTVENSTFINNDTTAGAELIGSSSSPRGYGGAIYTDGVSASSGGENGTIAIRDSLFEDNKGAGAGGAAFLFLYPGDDVVIENTNIINNSVIEDSTERAQGGGIRLGTGRASDGRTAPGTFTISNSTFEANTSEIEGGGLWIDRKLDLTRVDIINSTFSENRAESADGTVGLGGAITAYAPTNITNTTITNNFAGEEAGAIYTNPSPDFTPDIEVKNTIFDRNTAGNVNGSQQTNIQLIDQGGNLQFPPVDSNDELVTANIAIGDPNLGETIAIRRGNEILIDDDSNGIVDRSIFYGSGAGEDQYLVGDWDGDGTDELAVRRGNEILIDDDSNSIVDRSIFYGTGNTEDQYLVGDWDGDGIDEIAVRRGNEILIDDDSNGIADRGIFYGNGNTEDQYLVGDWDGDGTDELAVRRGNEILIDNDSDGTADSSIFYGTAATEDQYLVGDWDNDGTDEIAVRRENNFLMNYNTNGLHDQSLLYGLGNAEDEYLIGIFSDPVV